MPFTHSDGLSTRLVTAFQESAQNPQERSSVPNFAAFLQLGILAAKTLSDAYESWRDRVFAGQEQVEESVSDHYRSAFQSWLDAFDTVVVEVRRRKWDDEDEDLLPLVSQSIDAWKTVKATLAAWTLPSESRHPGFRKTTLTTDEADQINQWVEAGQLRLAVDPVSCNAKRS
jgi:hypothetical protein